MFELRRKHIDRRGAASGGWGWTQSYWSIMFFNHFTSCDTAVHTLHKNTMMSSLLSFFLLSFVQACELGLSKLAR